MADLGSPGPPDDAADGQVPAAATAAPVAAGGSAPGLAVAVSTDSTGELSDVSPEGEELLTQEELPEEQQEFLRAIEQATEEEFPIGREFGSLRELQRHAQDTIGKRFGFLINQYGQSILPA